MLETLCQFKKSATFTIAPGTIVSPSAANVMAGFSFQKGRIECLGGWAIRDTHRFSRFYLREALQ